MMTRGMEAVKDPAQRSLEYVRVNMEANEPSEHAEAQEGGCLRLLRLSLCQTDSPPSGKPSVNEPLG